MQEQFAALQKANVEMFFGVASRMVEGVERLAQLNMQTLRATLDDTLKQACQSLSVKEPQEWLALQDSLAAPTTDKVQAWTRQVFEIMAATQADLVRSAHAQWDASVRQARTQVQDLAKSAPAGSEAAVAALDEVIATTNALYETLQKTGEQAFEVTRSNLEVAAAAATKSARRASESQAAKR